MSKTKDRIRESQLRYRHELGQNFLYDEALLARLAEAAGVTREEDVLEIGPGVGSLTRHLCSRARRVLSIELDERLVPLLQAYMTGQDNFSLVQGDVMKLNLPEVTRDLKAPFHVVANIPYYITTPLIQLLLTAGLPLKSMALMVQREVAEKLLAGPGQEGWGPLAVRCRYFTEPRLALDVPAACFTPPPKVDSAFVVMPFRAEPAVHPADEADFFRVVGAAFSLRRKTLVNALMATLRLPREAAAALVTGAGLDLRVRGEQLSLSEFAAVSDAWTAYRKEQET
ncbi:MAG: ribosomal RNA small subunit methyltransferase A [Clostridia bacterium]|nr:ribosomal RNA small subunit methyltransferase A [Clostridia bacterium]